MKNEIKNKIEKIVGFKISIRNNQYYWTISRKDATKATGFGHFKNELAATFHVTRLDGCSFDIIK